jgi:hypothetical protein
MTGILARDDATSSTTPINYNVSELADVTKPGSSHGGVLCCR